MMQLIWRRRGRDEVQGKMKEDECGKAVWRRKGLRAGWPLKREDGPRLSCSGKVLLLLDLLKLECK